MSIFTVKIEKMRKSNELQIGKAGEYIVCADLIMMGLVAYPSEQGLPYDVVIDTGNKLLKCQVKTTSAPRKVPQRKTDSVAYIFNVKRHGKKNANRYTDLEVDIFALVELQNRSVIYIKNNEMPDTLNIRLDERRGDHYDEKGVLDYKKCIELYTIGGIKNKSEIARILNLQQAVVSKYLQPNYVPFISNARYWSDFKKDEKWFLNL